MAVSDSSASSLYSDLSDDQLVERVCEKCPQQIAKFAEEYYNRPENQVAADDEPAQKAVFFVLPVREQRAYKATGSLPDESTLQSRYCSWLKEKAADSIISPEASEAFRKQFRDWAENNVDVHYDLLIDDLIDTKTTPNSTPAPVHVPVPEPVPVHVQHEAQPEPVVLEAPPALYEETPEVFEPENEKFAAENDSESENDLCLLPLEEVMKANALLLKQRAVEAKKIEENRVKKLKKKHAKEAQRRKNIKAIAKKQKAMEVKLRAAAAEAKRRKVEEREYERRRLANIRQAVHAIGQAMHETAREARKRAYEQTENARAQVRIAFEAELNKKKEEKKQKQKQANDEIMKMMRVIDHTIEETGKKNNSLGIDNLTASNTIVPVLEKLFGELNLNVKGSKIIDQYEKKARSAGLSSLATRLTSVSS